MGCEYRQRWPVRSQRITCKQSWIRETHVNVCALYLWFWYYVVLATRYFDYLCIRIACLTGCRSFPAKTGNDVKIKKKNNRYSSVSHFVGPMDCLTAYPHATNFVHCLRNASSVSRSEM